METRLTVMRNKKAKGFTGTVTYDLRDKENAYNRTTHMLAHYAEYTNIGRNKKIAHVQTKLSFIT